MFNNREESILIFGSSPYINDIKDIIPQLQSKYTSIGMNIFPVVFPNVTYWNFNDYMTFTNIVKPNYNNQKIITNFDCYKKEIINIPNIKVEYLYEASQKIQNTFNNKLFMERTSLFSSLNYAMLLGYKKIFLIGVDLDSNWDHFYGNQIRRSRNRILKIRDNLYKFKDYINIYKVNPNSDLEIEYKSIEQLLL